jgi:hypothetical protein
MTELAVHEALPCRCGRAVPMPHSPGSGSKSSQTLGEELTAGTRKVSARSQAFREDGVLYFLNEA